MELFIFLKYNKVTKCWVEYWRDVYNPAIEIRQMHFVTCSYELYDETELGDKVVRM